MSKGQTAGLLLARSARVCKQDCVAGAVPSPAALPREPRAVRGLRGAVTDRGASAGFYALRTRSS